jgi:hypothetical protein
VASRSVLYPRSSLIVQIRTSDQCTQAELVSCHRDELGPFSRPCLCQTRITLLNLCAPEMSRSCGLFVLESGRHESQLKSDLERHFNPHISVRLKLTFRVGKNDIESVVERKASGRTAKDSGRKFKVQALVERHTKRDTAGSRRSAGN